jgi:hypothetical protein
MGISYESILDNETLVYYIIIIIGIMFAFSKLIIGLNLVFGFVIGVIVVYFLYTDYKGKQDQENKVKAFQESLLLPKPETLSKYENIIKYLFSVQDFYVHNPQAYEEMVNAIENFFRVYEETVVNPKYAGRNHDMMIGQKRTAMNALHSIIYNCPTNKEYTEKLDNAVVILEEVLQEYLDKVERIQKLYLHENGYDIDTKIIDKSGIMPANSFDSDNDGQFSYDMV